MKLKIRQEREQRKWTLESVAKKLGITKAAYRNIEIGIRRPSYDVLVKLLGIYGYDDPRRLFAVTDEEKQ